MSFLNARAFKLNVHSKSYKFNYHHNSIIISNYFGDGEFLYLKKKGKQNFYKNAPINAIKNFLVDMEENLSVPGLDRDYVVWENEYWLRSLYLKKKIKKNFFFTFFLNIVAAMNIKRYSSILLLNNFCFYLDMGQ